MNSRSALAYHQKHKPQALLVQRAGRIEVETYDDGYDAETPHALYSGTKSFWGISAVAAARERLLAIDEPIWSGATVRHLLSLTAGVPFGGLGSAVPSFEKALSVQPRDLPGRSFTYGGIPLQIFGAVFSKRLRPLGLTPQQYLQQRILDPAGVHIASWRTLKDGTQPLPTGAFLTARNWARYGAYVCANSAAYAECFTGTAANPRYGLGWWLAPAGAPPDLFYASGSGGQAMYVVPSRELVIVRFGGGGSYTHEAFLRRCEFL